MEHRTGYFIHRAIATYCYIQLAPSSIAFFVNSLACPRYSVNEISSKQLPFSHICSIILGIFLFEPTPDIGFIIACTFILFPSILTVYKD